MAITYLNCILKSGLSLRIIPDSDIHLDGHPVLTWTYSIYRNKANNSSDNEYEIGNDQEKKSLNEDQSGLKKDDSYLGYITVEQPQVKIVYMPEGEEALSAREVEEVIERIINYRNNPQLWKY
ncbi:hypothetical protein [Daejeonella oryzae]|uniref:hypothetical protein n=1 Tax=Daejeonella oryzae TaxID=1122943 RepID=UPI0003FF814C|nr:hypothetical protein [Daejeonella oryzae]